eukprot:GEMP01007183.1.p1 GENE.GEMP01007183.1~~GEMP01007183.1.p1  ORF type:complete len:274 (+),score=70.31 GEMP01007183.1:102-923(+)
MARVMSFDDGGKLSGLHDAPVDLAAESSFRNSARSKRELQTRLSEVSDLCKAEVDKAKTRNEKKKIVRKYSSMKDELLCSECNKKKEDEPVPEVDPAKWRQSAVTQLRNHLKENAKAECADVKDRHEKQEVEFWFKRLDSELGHIVDESPKTNSTATPTNSSYENWKDAKVPQLVKDLKMQCVEMTKHVEDPDKKQEIVREYRTLVHRLRVEEDEEEVVEEEQDTEQLATMRWEERIEFKRNLKSVEKERTRYRNERRSEKQFCVCHLDEPDI